MKRKEYKALRARFKVELLRRYENEVPLGLQFNLWLFRTLVRRRFIFFMQQVSIYGTAWSLAHSRALDWTMEQIKEWQKARA